jgi:hypothetical protein
MRDLWLILVAMAVGPAVLAADPSKADRSGLRTVQKQLRSESASQRVEAVERLRELPTLEGAKFIVPALLIDPAREVRHAAYDTLLGWKDQREVCLFLLKNLQQETRSKQGELPVVMALTAVLLASDLPDTQRDVTKLLDDYVAKGQDGASFVTTLADELGQQDSPQALASLQRMIALKCFSSTFACRRAVIQNIIRIRLPQAVERLIELLPQVDGEARGDIVRYLAELSGEQHGINRTAWQTWWKGHKDTIKFPAIGSSLPAATALPGQPSYYGLAIHGQRIVFVIDISGSMEGARLAAAKRELIQAIDSLPNETAFGLVVFNNRVAVWQRNLTPATPATKQAARVHVGGLRAGGMTAAYDALEAAFWLDAEAIYFLSDGEPTAGRIIAPQAILAAIAETNRSRRMSLYTIGIAPGQPGSRLDSFMRSLAEQNYGTYRRVVQ